MVRWRAQAAGEDRRCRAPSAADAVLHLFKLLRRDAHSSRVPRSLQEVENLDYPKSSMSTRSLLGGVGGGLLSPARPEPNGRKTSNIEHRTRREAMPHRMLDSFFACIATMNRGPSRAG